MTASIGPYPMHPPKVGSILLTSLGPLCHMNEFPKNYAREAIVICERIYAATEDYRVVLSDLMTQLADVPEEPLLSVDKTVQGCLVGFTAAAFLVHHEDHREQTRRILLDGGGVILLRFSGSFRFPEYAVEMFDDWSMYQQAFQPSFAQGGFVTGKSTLL